MIDPRLRTFLTVCETMNYTAAARKLNITQPAVSQHMHILETYYKVKLFTYKGKKVYITPKGELLRKAATAMLNDDAELRRQMQDCPGKVRIEFGVTKTIGEYVIASPLAQFIRNHPDASIKMHIANSEELAQEIKGGKIQFALAEGYFDPTEYDSMMYRTVPFIPVCSVNHQFQKGKGPRLLTDLFGERLLVREPGSGMRRFLENHLALMGCKISDFHSVVEVSGMHTILQLLEEDVGISFLFEAAADDLISKGKLQRIRLSDFSVVHDFRFIWEKGSKYGDQYRALCTELAG